MASINDGTQSVDGANDFVTINMTIVPWVLGVLQSISFVISLPKIRRFQKYLAEHPKAIIYQVFLKIQSI